MPTPTKPSLPPVPGSDPVPVPVPVPVPDPVAPPKTEPPMVGYDVTCIEIDSMERAVSVQEPEGVHACVRRVYWARFELDPKPLTHPAVSVKVESLEPLPFEPRKTYTLTFQ